MYRLTGRDVEELVDVRGLISDLKEVLLSKVKAPKRLVLEHMGSWFGVMPAAGLGYYSVKLVGVYPENPEKGLPLVRGVLLLFNAKTGERLLEAPAEEATGWRTATASALALEILGYRGGGVVGVIGSGVQAKYHVRVLQEVFGFDTLLIHSRTRERAEEFARAFGGRVASLEELLAESDVIIAATTSRTPVVKGSLVKKGSYVVSVGAPWPVRELDEDTIRRSSCVLVDTKEGVREETDEIPPWATVIELSEALAGKSCEWGDIKVYKSVGMPLLDLAIAIHLYKAASARKGR